MPSTPNPNTPPACSPNSFKHEIVRRTLNNVNEEVVAYAMYSWKPCQAGITAITSFLVSVFIAIYCSSNSPSNKQKFSPGFFGP